MPKNWRGSAAAYYLSGSKQKNRAAFFNRNDLLTYHEIQQHIVMLNLPRNQYHLIPHQTFSREKAQQFALYMGMPSLSECAGTVSGCVCVELNGTCLY
jgi:hypothetical protein